MSADFKREVSNLVIPPCPATTESVRDNTHNLDSYFASLRELQKSDLIKKIDKIGKGLSISINSHIMRIQSTSFIEALPIKYGDTQFNQCHNIDLKRHLL